MKEKQTFNIVVDTPFENCERIYPTQQRKVRQLINDLQNDSNILQVYVFGSSTSERCHRYSDLDIYTVMKSKGKVLKKYYPFTIDLWTNYSADESLKKAILRKGVKVYDQKRNIV